MIALGTLARVDVEVVEPEVGQHFLQLPFAVDRAQRSSAARARPAARWLAAGPGSPVSACFDRRRLIRIRTAWQPPALRSRRACSAGCSYRSAISRELRVSVAKPLSRAASALVGNPLGVKLLVDVLSAGPSVAPARRRRAAARSRSGSGRGRSPGRRRPVRPRRSTVVWTPSGGDQRGGDHEGRVLSAVHMSH